jgi:hypothetical protein
LEGVGAKAILFEQGQVFKADFWIAYFRLEFNLSFLTGLPTLTYGAFFVFSFVLVSAA